MKIVELRRGMGMNTPSQHYVEVEYIESSGTQSIDTLISGLLLYGFRLVAKGVTFVADKFFIYGTGFYVRCVGATNGYGVMTNGGQQNAWGWNFYNKSTWYTENNAVKGTNMSKSYTPPMCTGGSNITLPAGIIARFYEVKLYGANDVLLFDGIPARDNANIGGLYDKVSGTFFTSSVDSYSVGEDVAPINWGGITA